MEFLNMESSSMCVRAPGESADARVRDNTPNKERGSIRPQKSGLLERRRGVARGGGSTARGMEGGYYYPS